MSSNDSRRWSRVLALGAGIAILWFTIGQADWPQVVQTVSSVGLWGFSAILIPQSCCLLFETWGWQRAFALLGFSTPLYGLWQVRAGTEALSQSLPAGPMVSESITPSLLKRFGVPTSVTLAAMVARRYCLIWTQGTYILLVTVLGFSWLQASSRQIIHTRGLGVLAVCLGFTLIALATSIRLFLAQSSFAEQVRTALQRTPLTALRTRLEQAAHLSSLTDSALGTFFSASLWSRVRAASPMLLGWLFETLETLLILRMLGFHFGLIEVACMEMLVSLVRHILFVLPAGLGAQDAAYVLFLTGFGAPDPLTAGAAFSVLKRAKELCWIALGYVVLSPQLRRSPETQHPSPQRST